MVPPGSEGQLVKLEAAPVPGLAQEPPYLTKADWEAPQRTSIQGALYARPPSGPVHRREAESKGRGNTWLLAEASQATCSLACVLWPKGTLAQKGGQGPRRCQQAVFWPVLQRQVGSAQTCCSHSGRLSAEDNLCPELEAAHVTPKLGLPGA